VGPLHSVFLRNRSGSFQCKEKFHRGARPDDAPPDASSG
jgi:hypothetical protein